MVISAAATDKNTDGDIRLIDSRLQVTEKIRHRFRHIYFEGGMIFHVVHLRPRVAELAQAHFMMIHHTFVPGLWRRLET